MSATQLRISVTAGFFLCIFVFGFWLSRSGKPYNLVIFTIHKLVALGAVIYLAMSVYKIHQTAPLDPAFVAMIVVASLYGITAFVTGALLSLDKIMPLIVLRLHRVIPYLILLSTAASFYFIWKNNLVPNSFH